MATIDNLMEIRMAKLDSLISNGVNPYPAKSFKEYKNKEVINEFSKFDGKSVTLTGRITSIREHGKITFIDILDEEATIQLLFSREALDDNKYSFIKNLDLGDFLQATGEVFKTNRDAISIKVTEYLLISKALRPIPSEYFGIKDEEERVRRRYLDLIVSQDSRERFKKLSKFTNSMRNFLINEGFIEVSTSILEATTGGAEANPFITHHDTLGTNFYLRIALELQLKRLIVGGYEKVFEIGKVFRNEGMDKSHLQEFNMMEFYWAYADYEMVMELTERLYKQLIEETFGTMKFTFQGKEIDFTGDWQKLDYSLALKDAGVDLDKYPDTASIAKLGKRLGLEPDPTAQRNRWIDRIYKKLVRPYVINPTFLINHPVDISPLAKRKPNNPLYTERFQVLIVGEEIGNAFSELNDPIDQRKRFEEQQKLRDSGDNEAQMMDEDFVEALEYGMPPTGGFGVGVERFFSLLSDCNIRDVVLFPPTKKES